MIEIIFLDIDGCLSDGGIYKGNNGEEFKRFDVKDGFALEQWNKRLGKISAIITGKTSQIVENRARELGVKYCFQGVKDKFAKASEILGELGLSFENAAAIGDDLNDFRLLNSVKIAFTPNDAFLSEVNSGVEFGANYFKLSKNGGRGAVREMIEIIVRKCNLQEKWLEPWL